MRRRILWGVSGGLLALTLAGCGATVSVTTQVQPNGSGTIIWTAADTPHNLTTVGHLTPAQVTTLLKKAKPPGAVVSGPTKNHSGQDVWTITDSFRTLAQLNHILQAATGTQAFHPVALSSSGVPWARTYVVHDPNNNSGNQWNWVTRALQAAHNSYAGNWESSASQDTVRPPWIVPSGQPSWGHALQQGSQPANWGVQWYRPHWTLQLPVTLSPTPHVSSTWTMTFGAKTWHAMSPATQSAIASWWHRADSHAHKTSHQGVPSWTAQVSLKTGSDSLWGTLHATTTTKPPTFWRKTYTTALTFTPSSLWLLPSTWAGWNLHTPNGWNGLVGWRTAYHVPLGGTVQAHSATLASDGLWTTDVTWTTLRWDHVAAVGLGAVIAAGLALWGGRSSRRRQALRVRCPHCGATFITHEKFCTRCGTALS